MVFLLADPPLGLRDGFPSVDGSKIGSGAEVRICSFVQRMFSERRRVDRRSHLDLLAVYAVGVGGDPEAVGPAADVGFTGPKAAGALLYGKPSVGMEPGSLSKEGRKRTSYSFEPTGSWLTGIGFFLICLICLTDDLTFCRLRPS